MTNEVTCKTCVGNNTATHEVVELDFDDIRVNGTRVGFAPHAPGSVVRMLRVLSQPTIDDIVKQVNEQRKAQGKPEVTGAAKLPEPDQVRKLAKQIKRGS